MFLLKSFKSLVSHVDLKSLCTLLIFAYDKGEMCFEKPLPGSKTVYASAVAYTF